MGAGSEHRLKDKLCLTIKIMLLLKIMEYLKPHQPFFMFVAFIICLTETDHTPKSTISKKYSNYKNYRFQKL